MPTVHAQSPNDSTANSTAKYSIRVDLHCHSRASTEADEAVLQAIRCPESYSAPLDIYHQAKCRGMDFVTITDHDSISGVAELADHPNVLVGEEVTCYFPEDRCKIHLLTWGITPEHHAAMQRCAYDIYALAGYVAKNRIAHAVAHPLYRQNGILDRRHVERLLLLFSGFECLNGAHSMTHRQVFEPILDALDVAEIRRLERVHHMDALYPNPWLKTRTAGSDDHGLFNIGRTWTEFPESVRTTQDLLEHLRQGLCRPGGEAGSSIKLAHNFFGVGMRYFAREVAGPSDFRAKIIGRVLGETPPPSRIASAALACKVGAKTIPSRLARMLGISKPPRGTKLLAELLAKSALKRGRHASALTRALKEGRAPLAEHEPMFDLICRIDRDVTGAIFQTFASAINTGQIGAVIDTISTVIAQQSLLLPYYFALFHQNQERDLLNKLKKRRGESEDSIRVALFTDSNDESDDAGRLAGDFGRFAEMNGFDVTILAASAKPSPTKFWRNFTPLVDAKPAAIPSGLKIPPLLEVMEWSDRRQFDVIIASGVGPMALCGWLASRMLRAPLIVLAHHDLSAQLLELTGGDYRLTTGLEKYIAWLYRSAAAVLTTGSPADKITGVCSIELPADDRLASIWSACTRAVRKPESHVEPSAETAAPSAPSPGTLEEGRGEGCMRGSSRIQQNEELHLL